MATNAPLRVLRVIPHLGVGGVQRQLALVLPALRELGIEVSIACLEKRGELAADFEAKGFAVHVVRARTRFDPLAMWSLRQLAHRLGAGVVHGHMYAANMTSNLAFWRATGISVVNGYHNEKPASSASQYKRITTFRHWPAAYLAVSEAVAATLVSLRVPADRIRVIHNGVRAPEEIVPPPARGADDPLEIVWAGRFVGQKRVPFLIDVAKACQQRGVPAHFTLVGDGPDHDAMRERVRASGLEGMVALPGVSHNVFEWLARSHVFVSASHREGFPNALLEACAAGRASVVSDIAPHRELLGSTGAGLCLGDDPVSWAEALGQLAADPARVDAMGEAARKLGAGYTVRAAAEKTAALYRELVARRILQP